MFREIATLSKEYRSYLQPFVTLGVAVATLWWFTSRVKSELRKITGELRGQLEAVSRKFDTNIRKTVNDNVKTLERTQAESKRLLSEAKKRAEEYMAASEHEAQDSAEDEASRWGEMQSLWSDVRSWASDVLDDARNNAKNKKEIASLKELSKTDYSVVILDLYEHGWISDKEAEKAFEMSELHLSHRNRKKWLTDEVLMHFKSLHDKWHAA
jgi:hypothetical protein